MGSIDDYDLRTFPAALDAAGAADPATAAWIDAENRGFHDPRMSAKVLARSAERLAADGRRLTGAYAPTAPAGALGADTPVATFAWFPGTLNVGGPELLPVHLVSNVTVRPTHRRRGLLRGMMTADLKQAVDDGYAVAALTASEAGIYRRFGFGEATWVRHVVVTTDARFRMIEEPSGRCELIEAAELRTLGPEVFARFHAAHPGSIDRHAKYWDRVSGADDDKGEPDPAVYAAAHYDDSGTVDGYVSYKFKGWETEPHALEIIDLVAADDAAYLGLWDFLASVDLVTRVEWEFAPVDDPLPWAITDSRLVRTGFVEDWVWLRVLDVKSAFEARGYLADGRVVLQVTDALGYAAGTFELRVTSGRAEVRRDDSAEADAVLDAAALGALYLGGADPRVLAAAGRLRPLTPGAVQRVRALLQPVAPLYGISHF
ncbi:GNAT family N-acetyltransferase [Herbiconiux liangxiaofengii]|uniref:GNAT family N-acetyltransferase n=1 Tax=Herbiconiux liangxiaofengii TaxID=3342795 RepID=UPI0035B73E68